MVELTEEENITQRSNELLWTRKFQKKKKPTVLTPYEMALSAMQSHHFPCLLLLSKTPGSHQENSDKLQSEPLQ